MRKKPFHKIPLESLKEQNSVPPDTVPMDPDARAAALLERLDRLRKKVHGIRKDLEEIERDLRGQGQDRNISKP